MMDYYSLAMVYMVSDSSEERVAVATTYDDLMKWLACLFTNKKMVL